MRRTPKSYWALPDALGLCASALVLFAVLMLAACATQPASPSYDTMLKASSAPCLPPGMTADFLYWPVVGAVSGALSTESGRMVRVIQIRYQRGADAVVLVWAGPSLVAIDPHPDDASSPFWANAQFTFDRGANTPLGMRDTPGLTCDWKKAGGGTGGADDGGEKA
jgi:hypothetical protein